ncbi:MAG: choice-of-anchor Q domain-containing protein, partial [Bacteroidota bacterium]
IYASGTGIINNQDPLFEDAPNCDFNVQSCSPVINAGITPNPTLSTDIVGNNRDANYDFGAYEFQGNPVFYNGNGIVYVDIDVSGGNQSGSDWTNAFTNLQDALDLIQENDCVAAREIWVAEGTYKPTKDNPTSSNNTARDVSFYIDTDSIRIYGGFQGVETMRTQRNISLYKTILSGDLNDNDTPNLSGTALRNDASRNDNAYTIFYFDGTTVKGSITAATVVDGFSIEGGNANSSISVALGGAIYNDGNNGQSSPTISACSFARNNALRGGAIYNNGENGQSNPIISACSFDNNQATDGGAIYNGGNFGISNPVISNCIFTSNTVIDRGGAIYSNGQGGESSPVINSCRFTNNSVPFSGGALYFFGDGGNIQAQITNCIFQNNGADHIGYDDGDANQDPDFINCTFEGASEQAVNIRFFDSGQTPIDFTNCIFWNNTSLTNNDAAINPQNCIVGDDNNVFAGSNGNLNQDLLFVDAANGDLTLQICSPAIDSGDNIAIDTFSMDFLGNTRIVNGTVDIGAYEFQGIAYTGTGIIYIDQDASSGNNSGSD